MADWIIESPENQSEETFPQQLKRVGIATGVKSLQPIQDIGNLLFKNAPQPVDYLKKQFNLSNEYLEPKSGYERLVQRFGQGAIPSALLGGVPGLALNAVGSGAASAAGELGAPEALQDVIQLGTEIATGRGASKIPGIGKTLAKTKIPTVREAQKAEYELAKAATAKSLPTKASSISKAMNEVGLALESETDPKTHKAISHALEALGKNINADKINPSKAVELRKNLYRQGNKLDKAVSATYIQPLTKGINDFFVQYGAENPTFYKHLNKADRLTEFRHMTSYLGDLVKKLDLGKIPGGKLAEEATSYILSNLEKTAKGAATNPAFREYLTKSVRSAGKNDAVSVVKNITNLAELLPVICLPSRSRVDGQ